MSIPDELDDPFDFGYDAMERRRRRRQPDPQVMDDLSRTAGGVLYNIVDWLTVADDALKAAVLGGDPVEEFNKPLNERLEFRDYLTKWGLNPHPGEKTWTNWAMGVVPDMLIGVPATGPLRAFSKAGRVADAAGLMRQAPQILSRKAMLGEATGDLAEITAKRRAAIESSIGRPMSATDAMGRPLIGRRMAQRHGTLQDLIDYAPDPGAARRSVLDAIGGGPDAEKQLAKLANQPLGGGFGFRINPLATSSTSVPLGSARFEETLDNIDELVRWGRFSPGRALHWATNAGVDGALDAESQMVSLGKNLARRQAMAGARRLAAEKAAELAIESPQAFSLDANRSIGRLIEEPVAGAYKAADDEFLANNPAVRKYIDWWKARSAESPEEFARLGLRGVELADPNLGGYLPRKADGLLEDYLAQSPLAEKRRAFNTLTSSQMERSENLMIPGGRDTIAFDLSLDPFLVGAKRGAATDDDAAAHVANKLFGVDLNGATKHQSQQARELARLLHQLPQDRLLGKDGVPLFGQHPVEMIGRYLEEKAGAEATQKALVDSLAHMAENVAPGAAQGGGRISLTEAIQRIGARDSKLATGETVGASGMLRQALGRRWGVDPDSIRLAEIAIPAARVDMLTRTMKEPAKLLSLVFDRKTVERFDAVSRYWKEGLLRWPSRLVRDAYSGIFSNWLIGAFRGDAYQAAWSVIQHGPRSQIMASMLARMPRYQSLQATEAFKQYWADVAAGGMLAGALTMDRGQAALGAKALSSMPGLLPEFVAAPKTWNPFTKLGYYGNVSDVLTRLAGYNSLLLDGVDPIEAATRIKGAHVDYSSLTPFERTLRDNFLPFYAYWSRSFQEVVRQLYENPGGRYTKAMRVYERGQETEPGEYVPPHVRQNFAAAMRARDPLGAMFAAPEGLGTTFLTDIDLPGVDQLNLLRPGDPRATLHGLVQNLDPKFRIGYELLTGNDLFTGDTLRASRGMPLGKIVRAATGDDTASVPAEIEKLLELVPYYSRPARLVAQLVDQDQGLSPATRGTQAAINNLTGVKLRTVTNEDAARDAVRRLQEMASPITRDWVTPYVPEAVKSTASPELLYYLDQARALQEQLKLSPRRQVAPMVDA